MGGDVSDGLMKRPCRRTSADLALRDSRLRNLRRRERMERERQIPVSLTIVAVLFIIGGVSAVIEVVLKLMRGHININFGVLGLFIGPGLLALRPGWRICALVFTWIALIGVPIVTVLLLMHSGPVDFNVFGMKAGYAPKELGLVMAVAVFCLALWQYHVLMRPDVRALFGVNRSGEQACE